MPRPLASLSLFAALFGGALLARAENPSWVRFPLEPASRAVVTEVLEGPRTGVWLARIEPGMAQGIATGMHCLARRGDTQVAELVVVAADADQAVALLTGSSESTFIQPGDQLTPKLRR